MSANVDINPQTQTVTASRNLRKSGSSVVLTIPPELLQSLNLHPTDTVQLTADWGEGELRAVPQK